MFHVALVGCGRWGAHILRDLRQLGCRVTVVARSQESVARAREGGADEVVAAIDDLGGVDAAVAATPVATHAAVLRQLLPLGIPLFCEKPLCTDVETARELARQGDGRLFVMDKWRYHPGVEALARLARSEELGAVTGVLCVREQWGSPHRDVDTTWIHLPHDLAIGLEILGHLPEPRAAVAERVGGEVTGLHGFLGRSPWLSVAHSAAAPANRRLVRVTFEGGTATLADSYAASLAIHRGPPERESAPEARPFEGEWPLLSELRAFVDHLGGGPPPRSTAAEHLAIVERLAGLRALAGLP